jgi:hypothetical protein
LTSSIFLDCPWDIMFSAARSSALSKKFLFLSQSFFF